MYGNGEVLSMERAVPHPDLITESPSETMPSGLFSRRRPLRNMLVIVFAISMFSSAALLFLVEPMVAKLLLPMLGGTPAVWNTCLVFFQAVLLAAYLYAHLATKWLPRRAQIAVHLAVILLPLLIVGLLPVHLTAGWQPPADSNPVPWIMAMLLAAVGLPFFALSSTTPIMQRWFADSGHKHAADPYFLYAASNAGSLVGLLAYPLLLEPLLRLSEQDRLWSYAYALFAAMTIACGLSVWRKRGASSISPPEIAENTTAKDTWKERLRWVALAFVPSSLMLGVTTALTTDVPAIPLFWVLPLALYLASFVLVFGKRPLISHAWLTKWFPVLILLGLFPTVSRTKVSFAPLMLLYLLLLFGVAMFCHGELARSRPRVSRLTEFYLWVSVGGVLGGIFNSLVAPVIFRSAIEFPLVLIFAALLRPRHNPKLLSPTEVGRALRKDWLLPLALGLCMLTVILVAGHSKAIQPGSLPAVVFFGWSMLWCISFHKRRLRFALGVTALIVASSFYTGAYGRILDTERNFFGVVRVTDEPEGKYRFFIHSGTLHGMQSLDPARSREPLSYYFKSGPAGQIFHALQPGTPHSDLAIVGLGAGAMACYLQPDQSLTYYEIDPLVVRIAKDPRYFTFLSQCAPHANIVMGDARLKLRDAPDAHYSLIVLDAFSGDSIPMHLLTREALALYLRKLAPGGVLAFHISSLYLQLTPRLGNLASDAHLACLAEDDTVVTQLESEEGKTASTWVVMARSRSDLSSLAADTGDHAPWLPVQSRSDLRVWTDDYSNLLSAIRWTWGKH